MNRFICFCAVVFLSVSTVSSQRILKEFDLKPVPKGMTTKFLIQNVARAFYIKNDKTVAGGGNFSIGIADMVDKGKYFEFQFKSISEYHAVKSYDYAKVENSNGLSVFVIDVDGDTLHLDSITLGKENDYELQNRKGLYAESEYNSFALPAKSKLTHFALPGFYAIFGHDVIFPLPHDEFNAIVIRLNIPNEFYIFNERDYKTIGLEEGNVFKIIYADEMLTEYKADKDAPSYIRNLDAEKQNWEDGIKKKQLRRKK